MYPDNFDGSGKTEWSDYIVHFEQCANWNQWSDLQKAQMLSIHLRGEAQRLLSGLTVAQLTNYHAMKQIITDRYEPKEKDVAYRCQFRYRKRDKGESASDYGYHLNRLAQKAYPNLTLNQLEVHVIDQFITGLANYELQKHVQFGHPKSLHEAIGLATEYEALEGSVDRIKKPTIESEKIAPIITQKSDNQQTGSITLEQIGKLIDKKLNSLSVNNRTRSRSPTPARVQSAYKQAKEPKDTTTNNQASITEKQAPKTEKYCTYCKRNNHMIEECRTRKYHERKRQENSQQNCDAAYVITSQEQPMIVPQIIITSSTDAIENQQERQGDTSNTEVRLPCTEMSESKTQNRQVLQPIITSQIHEDGCEVTSKLATASCLYLNTDIFQSELKLLLDTGSPYSILSLKCFEKLQAKHDIQLTSNVVQLTAADGSHLEISGKAQLEFKAEGLTFQQDFIIAKIQGIVGILGMDFLVSHDGDIRIKKQILKTSKGRLKLHKQASNACARIIIADSTTIPANTETLLHCKVDQPFIRKEQTCSVEPANYLTSKGCFVARTLVDPDCDDVVMSVVNLSDQTVKLNQNSVLGKLEDVESIYSGQSHSSTNLSSSKELPKHLHILTENASPKLSADEKQKLSDLLIQYQDIFIPPDGTLGHTDLVEHEIETGDHKPIKIPPRRIPIFKRNQVDEELEKMLAQGIVEPSDSPWSAPICLVKKKDGTCRFCIDFRSLNAITVKDAYPLPRIDDTLDALSGSMWFSTLDLASGYWQIKLSERSKKKSAFVTPHRGLYHFNVMAFGLTNAPATFQRLMEKVLFGLTPQKCLCYLDDIIILGKTFDQALENLQLVFQRLREANLKLKPKKCFLFQPKVTYLGHVVSEDGITCDPAKIEAVKHWPTPTNKTEIRSILGLIGYYRKFIPDFSARASPLTKLTRKKAKFQWSEECDHAFLDLKDCLINSPILAFPRCSGTFVLDCDASSYALGGVLSQLQDEEERVIAYASHTLNPAQQQYCTTKRELLAVVTFMKHFKHYLLGQKFIIRTDHAPLIWLRNFKEPEGLIARWISIIETFDYEIHYRPGRHHQNADSLSRKPKRKCPNSSCNDCYPSTLNVGLDKDEEADNRQSVTMTDVIQDKISYQSPVTFSSPAPGPEDRKAFAVTPGADGTYRSTIGPVIPAIEPDEIWDSRPNWLPVWSHDELSQMQRDDDNIRFILENKLEGQKPVLQEIPQINPFVKALWYQWENLEVKNDVLYRRWKDNKGDVIFQLVVPKDMRLLIFDNLHSAETAGHFGRDRTVESIKRRYYWPGLKEDIARWVKQCDVCARAKPGPGLGKSALHQFRVNEIMRCVAVDIFGPLPLTEDGNEYIIVLGDYYSKWVDAWAVPNHQAQTVADKIVVEFFTKFGCPQQIHTDQGREFQSELFRLVCEKFGIQQTRTAPYRPNSDGLVERFNRTLKQLLKIFASENPKDWDDHLPFLLMAYRTTQHKSTGCTPNLIFLQREISCPLDLMVGPPPNTLEDICPIQYIEWIKSAMALTHDFVFRNLQVAATRQKTYHDRDLKPRKYDIGDWVWRWYPPTAGQKLGLGWTGPYLVTKRISDVTYSVQKSENSPVLNLHVDHLKPYEGRNQPRNWLNELDNTSIEDMSYAANTDILDITDRSEHEDPEIDSTSIQIPTNPNEAVHKQNPDIPQIRSRRERQIKPRQIWSPS
ncbi:MAG: reverse transcriptase domain-containing protein [Candidatus Thiodiazotropha endolucinida]